ncbi:uncharacterized protein LOC130628917 [Hydractinia symbiolongicarpus]|uniref:uncharacterized protein LOC130628917 n=1 Tax=Hydractinia symbiolongicarpus TaxID=13093 RepID=UPI00254FC2DE|nr:uncharacterized protein LOC130628917 [Hydractinia symbiolongicarpus]
MNCNEIEKIIDTAVPTTGQRWYHVQYKPIWMDQSSVAKMIDWGSEKFEIQEERFSQKGTKDYLVARKSSWEHQDYIQKRAQHLISNFWSSVSNDDVFNDEEESVFTNPVKDVGWSSRFSRLRTNQSDESDEVDILNVDSDDDELVDIETVKLGDMGLVTQLRCKTVEYSAALHGITAMRQKHCDVEKQRRHSLLSLFNDLQKAVSSPNSSTKLPKVSILKQAKSFICVANAIEKELLATKQSLVTSIVSSVEKLVELGAIVYVKHDCKCDSRGAEGMNITVNKSFSFTIVPTKQTKEELELLSYKSLKEAWKPCKQDCKRCVKLSSAEFRTDQLKRVKSFNCSNLTNRKTTSKISINQMVSNDKKPVAKLTNPAVSCNVISSQKIDVNKEPNINLTSRTTSNVPTNWNVGLKKEAILPHTNQAVSCNLLSNQNICVKKEPIKNQVNIPTNQKEQVIENIYSKDQLNQNIVKGIVTKSLCDLNPLSACPHRTRSVEPAKPTMIRQHPGCSLLQAPVVTVAQTQNVPVTGFYPPKMYPVLLPVFTSPNSPNPVGFLRPAFVPGLNKGNHDSQAFMANSAKLNCTTYQQVNGTVYPEPVNRTVYGQPVNSTVYSEPVNASTLQCIPYVNNPPQKSKSLPHVGACATTSSIISENTTVSENTNDVFKDLSCVFSSSINAGAASKIVESHQKACTTRTSNNAICVTTSQSVMAKLPIKHTNTAVKADTLSCTTESSIFSSNIVLPINHVDAPLSDAVLPINHVDAPLSDAVLPINHVDASLSDAVLPINHVGTPLSDAVLPISHVDTPLSDSVLPINHVDTPLSDAVLPLTVHTDAVGKIAESNKKWGSPTNVVVTQINTLKTTEIDTGNVKFPSYQNSKICVARPVKDKVIVTDHTTQPPYKVGDHISTSVKVSLECMEKSKDGLSLKEYVDTVIKKEHFESDVNMIEYGTEVVASENEFLGADNSNDEMEMEDFSDAMLIYNTSDTKVKQSYLFDTVNRLYTSLRGGNTVTKNAYCTVNESKNASKEDNVSRNQDFAPCNLSNRDGNDDITDIATSSSGVGVGMTNNATASSSCRPSDAPPQMVNKKTTADPNNNHIEHIKVNESYSILNTDCFLKTGSLDIRSMDSPSCHPDTGVDKPVDSSSNLEGCSVLLEENPFSSIRDQTTANCTSPRAFSTSSPTCVNKEIVDCFVKPCACVAPWLRMDESLDNFEMSSCNDSCTVNPILFEKKLWNFPPQACSGTTSEQQITNQLDATPQPSSHATQNQQTPAQIETALQRSSRTIQGQEMKDQMVSSHRATREQQMLVQERAALQANSSRTQQQDMLVQREATSLAKFETHKKQLPDQGQIASQASSGPAQKQMAVKTDIYIESTSRERLLHNQSASKGNQNSFKSVDPVKTETESSSLFVPELKSRKDDIQKNLKKLKMKLNVSVKRLTMSPKPVVAGKTGEKKKILFKLDALKSVLRRINIKSPKELELGKTKDKDNILDKKSISKIGNEFLFHQHEGESLNGAPVDDKPSFKEIAMSSKESITIAAKQQSDNKSISVGPQRNVDGLSIGVPTSSTSSLPHDKSCVMSESNIDVVQPGLTRRLPVVDVTNAIRDAGDPTVCGKDYQGTNQKIITLPPKMESGKYDTGVVCPHNDVQNLVSHDAEFQSSSHFTSVMKDATNKATKNEAMTNKVTTNELTEILSQGLVEKTTSNSNLEIADDTNSNIKLFSSPEVAAQSNDQKTYGKTFKTVSNQNTVVTYQSQSAEIELTNKTSKKFSPFRSVNTSKIQLLDFDTNFRWSTPKKLLERDFSPVKLVHRDPQTKIREENAKSHHALENVRQKTILQKKHEQSRPNTLQDKQEAFYNTSDESDPKKTNKQESQQNVIRMSIDTLLNGQVNVGEIMCRNNNHDTGTDNDDCKTGTKIHKGGCIGRVHEVKAGRVQEVKIKACNKWLSGVEQVQVKNLMTFSQTHTSHEDLCFNGKKRIKFLTETPAQRKSGGFIPCDRVAKTTSTKNRLEDIRNSKIRMHARQMLRDKFKSDKIRNVCSQSLVVKKDDVKLNQTDKTETKTCQFAEVSSANCHDKHCRESSNINTKMSKNFTSTTTDKISTVVGSGLGQTSFIQEKCSIESAEDNSSQGETYPKKLIVGENKESSDSRDNESDSDFGLVNDHCLKKIKRDAGKVTRIESKRMDSGRFESNDNPMLVNTKGLNNDDEKKEMRPVDVVTTGKSESEPVTEPDRLNGDRFKSKNIVEVNAERSKGDNKKNEITPIDVSSDSGSDAESSDKSESSDESKSSDESDSESSSVRFISNKNLVKFNAKRSKSENKRKEIPPVDVNNDSGSDSESSYESDSESKRVNSHHLKSNDIRMQFNAERSKLGKKRKKKRVIEVSSDSGSDNTDSVDSDGYSVEERKIIHKEKNEGSVAMESDTRRCRKHLCCLTSPRKNTPSFVYSGSKLARDERVRESTVVDADNSKSTHTEVKNNHMVSSCNRIDHNLQVRVKKLSKLKIEQCIKNIRSKAICKKMLRGHTLVIELSNDIKDDVDQRINDDCNDGCHSDDNVRKCTDADDADKQYEKFLKQTAQSKLQLELPSKSNISSRLKDQSECISAVISRLRRTQNDLSVTHQLESRMPKAYRSRCTENEDSIGYIQGKLEKRRICRSKNSDVAVDSDDEPVLLKWKRIRKSSICVTDLDEKSDTSDANGVRVDSDDKPLLLKCKRIRNSSICVTDLDEKSDTSDANGVRVDSDDKPLLLKCKRIRNSSICVTDSDEKSDTSDANGVRVGSDDKPLLLKCKRIRNSSICVTESDEKSDTSDANGVRVGDDVGELVHSKFRLEKKHNLDTNANAYKKNFVGEDTSMQEEKRVRQVLSGEADLSEKSGSDNDYEALQTESNTLQFVTSASDTLLPGSSKRKLVSDTDGEGAYLNTAFKSYFDAICKPTQSKHVNLNELSNSSDVEFTTNPRISKYRQRALHRKFGVRDFRIILYDCSKQERYLRKVKDKDSTSTSLGCRSDFRIRLNDCIKNGRLFETVRKEKSDANREKKVDFSQNRISFEPNYFFFDSKMLKRDPFGNILIPLNSITDSEIRQDFINHFEEYVK